MSGRATRNADTGELPAVTDDVDPEEVRYAPRPPRRHGWARRLAILALVLVLAALVAVAGYKWTQNQYYVANDGEQVVIYQGVEADRGVAADPDDQAHQQQHQLRTPAAPVHEAHQARRGGFAGAHGDSRHTAGVWVAEGEGEGVALGVGDGLAEAVGRGFFFPALAVAFLVGVGVGVGVGDGGQLTSVRRLLITARASVRLSALMPSLTCRARYGGRSSRT